VAKRPKSPGIPAEGAKPAAMPGFIKPQLATLKSKAPSGDQWLNEIKYDGYRVQLHASGGRAKAYTRNGLDWTKRFAEIAKAFNIPGQAILDGEAAVIKDGRTNFSELQAALAGGRQGSIEYYAFDLLYLDGYDLRAVAQIEQAASQGAVRDARAGTSAALQRAHRRQRRGDVRARREAELGRHRLEEPRRAVPLRPQRGVDQGEDSEARHVSRRRLR
jgi:bifunctional non-homologous end joining protein LigD